MASQGRQGLNRILDVSVKVLDADGLIRYWNSASERLHGYTSVEAVGRDFVDLIVPRKNRRLIRRLIREALLSGQTPDSFEVRLLHKDGSEVMALSNLAALSAGNGRRNLIAVDLAVSGSTQADAETSRLPPHLYGAEKMEMISELVGNIAHHYNNALAVILGNAELIQQQDAGEDVAAFVAQILQSGRSATQLTSQLLSYVKANGAESTPVDVHRTIRTVVETLAMDLDLAVDIKQRLAAESCVIRGDEAALRSALLNLALNGCEAVADGGNVTFATDVTSLDEAYCRAYPYEIVPGRYLRVTVSDTGAGMDEQTLRRALEPFFTTKPFGQAPGLGLANVYGCIKMHRGAMHLLSEAGRGTTVELYLPMSDTAAAAGDVSEASIDADSVILLAEPDRGGREALAEMLTRAGYGVRALASGGEVIDAYRSDPSRVALAVVAMDLPEMTGCEVLVELKEIDPAVRVLLAGGAMDAGQVQAALDAGVDGFIPRPYRAEQVLERVAKILADR
ncbi:hypothetical protein LCGC14_0512900 [marine sediment metagenome]|uniref:Histidine kinase n=1 Tax=marine sediment metagenome TaxID=412755 RepID=A0A0F9SJ88_9ZZZZ|nr:PAS domain S-box protein [Phycisphaerae bacterium]HDZ43827.1 PAS domain S-box protein [Phycisphaerae bacterium]